MTNQTIWPDLTVDRQAWQIACNELPSAPLSAILTRAQEIKELMTPNEHFNKPT